MMSLREYREPTNRLPDYLPWAALVAPGVILQKERVLQKTVAFRGPDLASSSGSELVSAVSRLNNALKRLGSGWAFFFEAQRFESNEYPTSTWTNPVAWLVDTERKNQFQQAGTHYQSSYFITFVFKLPPDSSYKTAAIFYDDPEKGDASKENAKELKEFGKRVSEIVNIMQGVFVEIAELDDDQTLSYLHSTISTNRHPVKTPETPMYLDALLPDQAFTLGDIPMLGDHFLPTCTISGFPSTSLPGLLDALNHLHVEYRWVTRFICLDQADAKTEIEKFRKRWWSKRKNLLTLLKEEASKQESALIDSDAGNKAADADEALQELGAKMVSFGYMTCSLCVWHTELNEAMRRMQLIRTVIEQAGFVVKDETLNSKEAWLGSLPGHVWANVRRPLVHTVNLAHVLPFSAVWAGDRENPHLEKISGSGAPHIACSTTGETPFWLNLNIGDVGHTLILGPTGAGKSTLLGMLELQWLRYPNTQIIIFDKDLSARAGTLAVGGHLYEPGSDDAPVSFQPLAEIHRKSELIWASQFIEILLEAQNLSVTPQIKTEIDGALTNLASDSNVKHRTLSVFQDLVQNKEVREALRPYTLRGNFGQLFDASSDDLKSGFWQMIEMKHIMAMGDQAVIPTLAYLFHRLEQRFDGRPTLLILDEAWLFLAHPVFMRKLQNWLKTLRKKNVFVVFATQEVADAADSPIVATILSATATKIYLPDAEALTPEMFRAYEGFGLSGTEIRILAQAQPKRDYYYRSSKGRRLFTLNMGEIALSFAATSSSSDHEFMDRMVADKNPEEFAPAILAYRDLDWAARLYEQAQERQSRGEPLVS